MCNINKKKIKKIRKDMLILRERWSKSDITRSDIIKDLSNYFFDMELPRVIPNKSNEVRNISDYYPKIHECSCKECLEKVIKLSEIKGHFHHRDKLFSKKTKEIKVMACVWLHNEKKCKKACAYFSECEKDLPSVDKILGNHFSNEGKHRTYAHFLLGYDTIKVNIRKYNYPEIAKNYDLIIERNGDYNLQKKKGFRRLDNEMDQLNEKAISNLETIDINTIDKTSIKYKLKKLIKKTNF